MADFFAGLMMFMTPLNLFLLVIGAVIGFVAGMIPGMSALTAIPVLLPFTYNMQADSAIIFMMAIYAAGVFAGGIMGITFNIPGTASGAITTIEGHPLFRKGRGNEALSTSLVCSLAGGIVGAVILMTIAPLLARLGLKFGPPEFAMLIVLALLVIGIISEHLVLGVLSAAFGALISTIGLHSITGHMRFTYEWPALFEGIGIINAVIGIYAIPQVIDMWMNPKDASREDGAVKVIREWKPWRDMMGIIRKWKFLILRSSIIGTVVGILPGAGASIASAVAYGSAQQTSKHPEEYGKGSVEGIAASESANNGEVGGSLVPTLALGLPGSSVQALILAALMQVGITPGPRLFQDQGPMVYSVLIGVMFATIIYVPISIVLIRLFMRIISIQTVNIVPLVFLASLLGTYSARRSLEDLWIVLVMGVFVWLLSQLNFSKAAILLGVILGPLLEGHMERSLLLSGGNWSIFVTRPISLILLAVFTMMTFQIIRSKRAMKRNQISG